MCVVCFLYFFLDISFWRKYDIFIVFALTKKLATRETLFEFNYFVTIFNRDQKKNAVLLFFFPDAPPCKHYFLVPVSGL